MPGNEVGRVAKGAVAGGRDVARGAGRAVGTARQIGGAGNPGLMRLLDVHAAATAGDTLVVIGLLTALFLDAPVDQARARVALYLVVTMVPFAILAPLIGPVLDRFRHGRRFAISASLGFRAVLAWVISLNVDGRLWLYVAAFGVVLFSRAHGVARSAALARLVPPSGLRLAQASARAAVFATVTAAIAAGIGSVAAAIGPQWALRLASVVFLVGAVIALTVPPLADTEPPEVLPRPFGVPWRGRVHGADGSLGERVLSGRVGATLLGSAGLRLLYGFLLIFLVFAIRSGSVSGGLLGVVAGPFAQLVLVAATFGFGTLVAHAIGTALRHSRPVPLQVTGIVLVGLASLYAAARFGFTSILLLCLATAVASGLAKVAVDAVVQERVPHQDQPNAFARTETTLMLAWLLGAAIGLVPHVDIRLGIAGATALALAAMVASLLVARRLRAPIHDGQAPTGPGGLVSGVLLHRGSHARQLPPVPVAPAPLPAAATPPAVIAPPVVTAPPAAPIPPAAPAVVVPPPAPGARFEPPVVEAPPAAAAPPPAPPGYHVFRPSPPGAVPEPPPPPAPPPPPPPDPAAADGE